MELELTRAQRAALSHVGERAQTQRDPALDRLAAVLVDAGVPARAAALLDGVRRRSRVTLSFHPDRVARDGRTVVEGLLADGIYRNQFETGLSSGSRTAFPGGERDRWEERIFGGAYQAPDVRDTHRPRYGALDVMHHPDGGSPRFGSCYLVLRDEVLDRCTFCFGDSHVGPADVGTIDAFEPVLAALLEDAQATGAGLRRPGMDVATMVRHLLGDGDDAPREQGRALDHYIEAQVHGPVHLGQHAAAVVADPSFRGTGIGSQLEALTARHGLTLAWHPGFVLAVDDVPTELRGPAIPVLARRLRDELGVTHIDAEVIGRAALTATTDEALQHVKQLWHCVVEVGSPHDG